MLINQRDGSNRVELDMLRQLEVLAPQTERLTALTMYSWGVLDRGRAAQLAAILRLPPNLRDLEVRTLAQEVGMEAPGMKHRLGP